MKEKTIVVFKPSKKNGLGVYPSKATFDAARRRAEHTNGVAVGVDQEEGLYILARTEHAETLIEMIAMKRSDIISMVIALMEEEE